MVCHISSCLFWDSQTRECALGEPVTATERTRVHRPRAESLTLTSLELGKVLAARNRTAFRAQGYCMYPLIRPGDTLNIEPKAIDQAEIGDIAVCRREGYLFGHRTIRKGVRHGRLFILTRPDGTSQGNDGPTFDSDFMGTVSSIERHGRRMDPVRQDHGPCAKRVIALRLKLIQYGFRLRQRVLSALAQCQCSPWYRRGVGPFFASRVSKGTLTVMLPFAGKWETGIFRSIPADKFDMASHARQGKEIHRWRLALHFNRESRPAAQASFVRRPPECPSAGWCLEDMQVRMHYRGAGLEEKVINKAKDILSRGGNSLQR